MNATNQVYQANRLVLVYEGVKGADYADGEVYEFNSLSELKKFRTKFPEKMKFEYTYSISTGTTRAGTHVCPVTSDHYKKFSKLAKSSGFDF
ncbi:hypothetical protein [Klebsiella oxytoca]|uniref:hypothetical protein n=1 Tax=Klebsiella oxytoca TaxID=571 RepID=UPI0034D28593